jgi:hypothetical protein
MATTDEMLANGARSISDLCGFPRLSERKLKRYKENSL